MNADARRVDDTTRTLLATIQGLDPDQRGQLQAALMQETVDLTKRDELTGLLNAEGFVELAGQMLASGPSPEPMQLVRIEVNQLDKIEQTYGPKVAQDVERRVADGLRVTFRSSDLLGRLGPNEFVALCRGTASREIFARRADDEIAKATADIDAPVRASVGVVRATGSTPIASLLDNGLSALRRGRVEDAYRKVGLSGVIGR